jgi:hypothetical protein
MPCTRRCSAAAADDLASNDDPRARACAFRCSDRSRCCSMSAEDRGRSSRSDTDAHGDDERCDANTNTHSDAHAHAHANANSDTNNNSTSIFEASMLPSIEDRTSMLCKAHRAKQRWQCSSHDAVRGMGSEWMLQSARDSRFVQRNFGFGRAVQSRRAMLLRRVSGNARALWKAADRFGSDANRTGHASRGLA